MTAAVGIVPAAGSGSRLGPIRGSKESLLVGGRPVIGYLLDRMAVGGADRIRVVTRPSKVDLIELVGGAGHEAVLAEPETVAASVLEGLRGQPDEAIALLGFPDSVWLPVDGFLPVRRAVEGGAEIALGLFQTDEPGRSDVVRVDERGYVADIAVKPQVPSGDWIWGCLAARVGALARMQPDDDLSTFVRAQTLAAPIPTIRLGRLLDIGTPSAYAAAEEHPVVVAARRSA